MGSPICLLLRLVLLLVVVLCSASGTDSINIQHNFISARPAGTGSVLSDSKLYDSDTAVKKPEIVFGICMATSRRSDDPLLYLVGNTSLKSIAAQTYPHYHLFMGQDVFNDADIAMLNEQVRIAGLDSSRVHFINIGANESEKNMYEALRQRWMFGGTSAGNAALRLAYASSEITHITLMGDDDAMLPSHLATLAEAYTAVEDNVGFIHTRANWLGPNPLAMNPWPTKTYNTSYVYIGPCPCGIIAATASWSKAYLNNTFQRQRDEQIAANLTRITPNDCGGMRVYPNDADLWDRVLRMINNEHRFKGVYVQNVTVNYSSKKYKSEYLLPRLYKSRTPRSL